MNRVIFENKLEVIVFMPDGRLVQTHKATFAQRHSFETPSIAAYPIALISRNRKSKP